MSEKLKINGKVLTWTRESLGLTAGDLAKKTKIKVDHILEFETGSRLPSFAQLKKLSNALRRPTAAFFLSEAPDEPEIPKDYRVLDESDISKLTPKTIYEIRKAQRKRQIAIELAKDLDIEIPEFNFSTNLKEDPKALARKYRKLLLGDYEVDLKGLSEGASFDRWKLGLESIGVLVFQAPLDTIEELRGLAVYDKTYPLILINTKDSPRGKSFSLLHEFCHLLLHTSGIGNINPNWIKTGKVNPIEVFCNEVAGQCLLPEDLFLRNDDVIQVRENKAEVTRTLLFRISQQFQASWEVVLRRFLETRIITESSYSQKREEIKKYFANKKKSSAVVPYDQKVLNWNGDKFTNLVIESFNQEKITAKNVSDYLGAKFQHLEKIQKRLNEKPKGA